VTRSCRCLLCVFVAPLHRREYFFCWRCDHWRLGKRLHTHKKLRHHLRRDAGVSNDPPMRSQPPDFLHHWRARVRTRNAPTTHPPTRTHGQCWRWRPQVDPGRTRMHIRACAHASTSRCAHTHAHTQVEDICRPRRHQSANSIPRTQHELPVRCGPQDS
jgi:hypothetical protein